MNFNPVQKRMELVKTALGKEPYDLILQNVRIVNVYSEEIIPGNIGIRNGRIVTLQAAPDAKAKAFQDGGNRFAVPGLIDTHVHIDSTLLIPEGLTRLTVPQGTTALFADPMEIANAAGYRGLEALFASSEQLPCHVYLEVSSRVPTAPGLETTGGEIGLEDTRKLLAWDVTVSLGELDPSKVLGLREEYFAKVEAALKLGKIANGHAIGLTGADLDAYACGGLSDDHECVTFEEAKERIRRGLAVLIREGSTERNLEALVSGLIEEGLDHRNWMMCTDDKHPNEIVSEGHINFMVNKAIEMGLSPIKAIQMASLNAAQHFRVDHEIGSISPGRWADILLVKDLHYIQPEQVFYKGSLVVDKGQMAVPMPTANYPEWIFHTVQLTRGENPADFRLTHPGPKARVRVIKIFPDQIINEPEEAFLPVKDGSVQSDPGQDILKLAVAERYGKNGNIGIGFIRGFGIQRGAISSTVAHDHHNLIIAGADDESMATCARAAQAMQGGLVVALGDKVLAQLPLPIGGLMSDQPPADVIEILEKVNAAAASLGCVLPAPLMTLSFVSLPTVPQLGITDMGLVHVLSHKLIDTLL